ncbi:hypothetical protein GCM10023187_18760 [Nibrella viscosa]|uniref:Curli production assembly/transport component CsgE n=1 Tax=Nibrella viscosa TaxID=1084524 RepID=A0ABP8KAX4_9BACT
MKPLLFLLLIALPSLAFAQVSHMGKSTDGVRNPEEPALADMGGTSLVVDNSRSKVGRDFYDLFYQHWTAPTAEGDTAQVCKQTPAVKMANWIVIAIEEIPSPGTACQIQITIDGEPVWQQFVQARQDLLADYALNAVEIVRESLTSYQEVQQQLSK